MQGGPPDFQVICFSSGVDVSFRDFGPEKDSSAGKGGVVSLPSRSPSVPARAMEWACPVPLPALPETSTTNRVEAAHFFRPDWRAPCGLV